MYWICYHEGWWLYIDPLWSIAVIMSGEKMVSWIDNTKIPDFFVRSSKDELERFINATIC